ncbi:MAG: hypothetical protein ACOX8U_02645 [Bradymonadia bacterium]|jgi:hypothetical protein
MVVICNVHALLCNRQGTGGVARDRLRFDTDVETERRRRPVGLCAMDWHTFQENALRTHIVRWMRE